MDGYFIRWNNIQVQETTADGAFVFTGNVGRAEVKGLEFELTAHPIEYLSAQLAGSWQDAYVTEGRRRQSTHPTRRWASPAIRFRTCRVPVQRG